MHNANNKHSKELECTWNVTFSSHSFLQPENTTRIKHAGDKDEHSWHTFAKSLRKVFISGSMKFAISNSLISQRPTKSLSQRIASFWSQYNVVRSDSLLHIQPRESTKRSSSEAAADGQIGTDVMLTILVECIAHARQQWWQSWNTNGKWMYCYLHSWSTMRHKMHVLRLANETDVYLISCSNIATLVTCAMSATCQHSAWWVQSTKHLNHIICK